MIDVNIMKQYIGTGLRCRISKKNSKQYDDITHLSELELTGINCYESVREGSWECLLERKYWVASHHVFPILHPLSDLTQPIDYKGGRFIPMIELAKISFPKFGKSRMFTIKDSYVDLGHEYTFHFDSKEVSFDCRVGYNGKRWDRHCYVAFQNRLFQQLYSWGFDLDGLIDKKLAVDVNSLKGNKG